MYSPIPLGARSLKLAIGSLCVAACGAPLATAQLCDESAVLRLPIPTLFDQLGFAVALDGDLAAMGRIDGSAIEPSVDAVELFRFQNGAWLAEASLTSPNFPGMPAGLFGRGVAVDGDRVAVGAPFQTLTQTRQGGAFVFERVAGQWVNTANLVSPNVVMDEGFGRSVALDGNTLVVGAGTGEATNPPDSFVYVYTNEAGVWTLEAAIPAPTGVSNFGASIALQGDMLVIGAPGAGVAAPNVGAAFLFTRQNQVWSQTGVMTGGTPFSGFGGDVAIDGDTILVGDSKAAYVFTLENGALTGLPTRLQPSQQGGEFIFGLGVALSGNRAIVGDVGDAAQASFAGAAWVFHRDAAGAWLPGERLEGSIFSSNGNFGWDVALSGARALIGSRRLTVDGVQGAGAGFIATCCPEDVLGNGGVGPDDLLALLASWGASTTGGVDINLSGSVGPSDLLAMLAAWGGCTLPAPAP